MNEESHKEMLSSYSIDGNKAMLALVMSIFIDMLGYTMIFPLLPGIAKDYGASDLMIGILISSNALMALIFGPLWGKLSDRKGRKPILLISQMGTLVSFLILGVADSIEIIFFSRILDGIFGGQMPIIRAYVSDITTPQTRPTKVAKIQAASAISLILGPSIGGIIGEINWRYPAFIAMFLSLLTIIITFRKLIESMPPERITDLKKQLTEKRIQNNQNESIFSKELILRLFQFFIMQMIAFIFTSVLPLIIYERYERSSSDIGILMTIVGFLMIINATVVMKNLIKKLGEKRTLIISIIVNLPVFLLFPYLEEFWMLYLFAIPFAFTRATTAPLIQSNILKAVDEDKQGEASGWSTNMQSIAQTVSPLISTGYLEIGIFTIGALSLSSYFMIGFTSFLFAVLLLCLLLFDFKTHTHLYDYEIEKRKPSSL